MVKVGEVEVAPVSRWARGQRRLWRFIVLGGAFVMLSMFVPAILPEEMGKVAYSAISFSLLGLVAAYLLIVVVWSVRLLLAGRRDLLRGQGVED